MQTMTLAAYVDDNNQEAAAKALNLTQGAISQMLKKERTVFVVVDENKKIIDCYEQKPIGAINSNDNSGSAAA